ncbi:MAG: nitroreductase family protein [Microgenomates group bacterium]
MDFFEVVKKRYSCRHYKNQPVEEGKLIQILESARLAPSAHNAQEWKFIVVKEKNKRQALAEAAGQLFIAQAPVIIVAVSLDPEHILSSGVPAYGLDLGIAGEHIALAATALGLASCWIGAFDQEEVKRILKVPSRYKVVALFPIGYPADKPSPKIRKNLQEIVCEEEFK